MSLKIEIINEDQDHYEEVNDFIDYVPEEADFEGYEYIEVDEEAEANLENIEAKLKEESNKIDRLKTLKFKDGSQLSDISLQDKVIAIKLEIDDQMQTTEDGKKFKCSNTKCKKNFVTFSTQEELLRHNQVHINEIAANECPICNKTLANLAKLRVHMETRHIPKIFHCDNCGKTFRSKDNLRLHMTHHRKHFSVECLACNKSYKSTQSLRYHLRQHFEHHQCENCGKVFQHKKLLLSHIASKHKQELMIQCRFCSRMFSRNDVKEVHEREIHKNGEIGSYFKCNECECDFDLREDLMKHKILYHYSGVIHTCTECGKNFKKKSLLEMHMNTHRGKSIQCNVCLMMFTFNTGLSKHKKLGRCKGFNRGNAASQISREELANIARKQLEAITVNPNRKTLEVDLFSDMNDESKDDVEIVEQPVKIKKKPGRKKKEETIIEVKKAKYALPPEASVKKAVAKKPPVTVRFMTKAEIWQYQHRNSTLPAETTVSSSGRIIKRKHPLIYTHQPFKPINLQKKLNIPFECDKCGALLDTKVRLSSHLNSHVRQKKHKCEKCDKTFCNIVSLKKHYDAQHQSENPFKEKRFQCDECPKRYISEFLLSQHKLSHQNLKQASCKLCSFRTNTIYDLKNHIKRIHQASKDFVCPEEGCSKTFKRRCDMENHRKRVHSKVKIYVKCPTCDVIVLEKGLQSHIINRHTEKALEKPFVCAICGKAERYEKNLKRHFEAVHAPTDRGVIYECKECPQIFYRRRELTAHSFEHFAGPIHNCSECENKYKTKKELTNHQYSHRFKEWPCHLCTQIFQTKSGRAKHIKRHMFSTEVKYEPSTEQELEVETEILFI